MQRYCLLGRKTAKGDDSGAIVEMLLECLLGRETVAGRWREGTLYGLVAEVQYCTPNVQ